MSPTKGLSIGPCHSSQRALWRGDTRRYFGTREVYFAGKIRRKGDTQSDTRYGSETRKVHFTHQKYPFDVRKQRY